MSTSNVRAWTRWSSGVVYGLVWVTATGCAAPATPVAVPVRAPSAIASPIKVTIIAKPYGATGVNEFRPAIETAFRSAFPKAAVSVVEATSAAKSVADPGGVEVALHLTGYGVNFVSGLTGAWIGVAMTGVEVQDNRGTSSVRYATSVREVVKKGNWRGNVSANQAMNTASAAAMAKVIAFVDSATEEQEARPIAVRTASLAAEYATFASDSGGTLAGQVFLKTRGGEVRVGAGEEVFLDPATAFTRGNWKPGLLTMDDYNAPHPHPFFLAARRKTMADSEGRFRFTGIAAGDYYVISKLTWEAGSPLTTQGGVISKLVKVNTSSPTEVMLTY